VKALRWYSERLKKPVVGHQNIAEGVFADTGKVSGRGCWMVSMGLSLVKRLVTSLALNHQR